MIEVARLAEKTNWMKELLLFSYNIVCWIVRPGDGSSGTG